MSDDYLRVDHWPHLTDSTRCDYPSSILCFCDLENIPINILKQRYNASCQKERRYTRRALAIIKLETILIVFRSSIRLFKAIREIQRLSLPITRERLSARFEFMTWFSFRSAHNYRRDTTRAIMVWSVIRKAFEGKEIDDSRSLQNWNWCVQFINHIKFMKAFAIKYRLRNATLLNTSASTRIYLNKSELYRKATSVQKQT